MSGLRIDLDTPSVLQYLNPIIRSVECGLKLLYFFYHKATFLRKVHYKKTPKLLLLLFYQWVLANVSLFFNVVIFIFIIHIRNKHKRTGESSIKPFPPPLPSPPAYVIKRYPWRVRWRDVDFDKSAICRSRNVTLRRSLRKRIRRIQLKGFLSFLLT